VFLLKKMADRLDRFLKDKRGLILNFDQGLEEGPKAFNLHSIDPTYVFNIALEGEYTGIIVQAGIAEKYMTEQYRKIPLIIKLNGRTALAQVNPSARQTCTVERAIKLGARAVAYTLYDGAATDPHAFSEFGRIVEQAHDYDIPVFAFMYAKQGTMDTDSAAYAARIALELGADAVKLEYDGNKKGFEWITKSAGRTGVFVADKGYKDDLHLLKHAQEAMQCGATGLTVGKTVWQHNKPFSLTRALHAVIFKDKTPEEALKYLQ
jgi:fructose-bisphosphate aldolase, class I